MCGILTMINFHIYIMCGILTMINSPLGVFLKNVEVSAHFYILVHMTVRISNDCEYSMYCAFDESWIGNYIETHPHFRFWAIGQC